MGLVDYLKETDDENNARWWKFIYNETPFDSLLIATASTIDRIKSATRQTYNAHFRDDMIFARATLSFLFYSVVFAAAGVASAFVILPMLTLSFIFSGLVIVFSSLSYSTFKVASSKYGHTVLFLNRLLRRLADSIPPSVGVVEVTKKDLKKEQPSMVQQGVSYLKSFNVFKSKKTTPVVASATAAAAAAATAAANNAPAQNDGFQVEMIGPGAPVIVDEEPSNEVESTESIHLQNQPAEPINLAEVMSSPLEENVRSADEE